MSDGPKYHDEWTDTDRRTLQDVRSLFPYMTLDERMVWVEYCTPIFFDSVSDCVAYLTAEMRTDVR